MHKKEIVPQDSKTNMKELTLKHKEAKLNMNKEICMYKKYLD